MKLINLKKREATIYEIIKQFPADNNKYFVKYKPETDTYNIGKDKEIIFVKDDFDYTAKRRSKKRKIIQQRKNKQKYYDYEYYNDKDYCDGSRVKQNKRKNYYYEEGDDDNSQNKKDTKKRRYQAEEYEDYCDGNNDETSDNDIDKTNKKKPHL